MIAKYNDVSGDVPLFGDLLTAEGRVYAVVNCRLVCDEGWHRATWTFRHGSKTAVASTFGQDPHKHTLILYVDHKALNIDATTVQHVSIRGVIGEKTCVFDRAPLCPPVDDRHFLTACTSTLTCAV
jgi:hypothetical protein